MNNNIKFSIIVPAYKDFFLKECIDSILAQTYKNFELIIVNDGSPNDLDSIIKLYDDQRILYYKRKRGLGAEQLVDNWNDCLKYVTGEYVINMGDDDKLLPDCLHDYVDLMKLYPNLDIYKTRLEFINGKSKIIGLQIDTPKWESVYSLMWHDWNGRASAIGDYLFKVSTLKNMGGFYQLPFAWHSDRITSFLMAQERGIAHTGKFGFQFRKSNLNITNREDSSRQRIPGWNKCENWYTEFLAKKPSTPEDQIYWNQLKSTVVSNIERIKTLEISRSYNISIINVFYWLKHKEKYLITNKQILQGIGIHLYEKAKSIAR